MSDVLVVSIKPKYMQQILEGNKLIELRKCKPSLETKNLIVVLYCTTPVKAVVGFCSIEELIEESPNSMWKNFSEIVGISKEDFFSYYENSNKAFGIRLSNLIKLKQNISLENIRTKIPNFSPPQTYKYFNSKDLKIKFKKELRAIEV